MLAAIRAFTIVICIPNKTIIMFFCRGCACAVMFGNVDSERGADEVEGTFTHNACVCVKERVDCAARHAVKGFSHDRACVRCDVR